MIATRVLVFGLASLATLLLFEASGVAQTRPRPLITRGSTREPHHSPGKYASGSDRHEQSRPVERCDPHQPYVCRSGARNGKRRW